MSIRLPSVFFEVVAMKKKNVWVGFAALALSFSSLGVQAEDLEFNLINRSSASVDGFYVSHSGTNQWEENLLEGAYLPPGNVITIWIRDGRDVCEYDISATFEDESQHEEYGLDLCEMESYTFEDAR
jgi:hypothetical protein